MNNEMIMVKSASDFTLVVNIPDIPLHRTWKKRGAQFPIERKTLLMAYYDPAVEALFKEGMLTTNDVEFLKEVGLIEENGTVNVVVLTEQMMQRMIKLMPVAEVITELKKLSRTQIEELAEYAISHYKDLALDRVDILSKASGKNIMKAIEHHRKAEEV
jgi:hypothetical protein